MCNGVQALISVPHFGRVQAIRRTCFGECEQITVSPQPLPRWLPSFHHVIEYVFTQLHAILSLQQNDQLSVGTRYFATPFKQILHPRAIRAMHVRLREDGRQMQCICP